MGQDARGFDCTHDRADSQGTEYQRLSGKVGVQRGNHLNGMAKTPAQITEVARRYCPGAIHVLRGLLHNTETPPAARISAAQALLDRGLGKPAQAVNVDVTVKITRIERTIVDPRVIDGECEEVLALPIKSNT